MNDELIVRWPGGALRVPLEIAGRIETVDALVPVPLAPEGVVGLGEVRGRVVTLVSPAMWWTGPSDAPAQLPSAQVSPETSGSYAFTFAAPYAHLGLLVDGHTALSAARPEDQEQTLLDRAELTRLVARLQPAERQQR